MRELLGEVSSIYDPLGLVAVLVLPVRTCFNMPGEPE